MSVYTDEQRKIERFDGIGVSYWGWVSHLAPGKDINLRLRRVGGSARPSTPGDFARVLEEKAREQWCRKARAPGETVGFHVAGYEPWEKGGSRKPVIYHVHNGHGAYVEYRNPDGTFRVIWKHAPPQKIQWSRDFPEGASRQCGMAPEALLDRGWSVRNGDFYITAKVLDAYLAAMRHIATVDQYRSAPLHLEAREALLSNAVRLAVRTQKEFTQRGDHVTVGGEVISASFRWPKERV